MPSAQPGVVPWVPRYSTCLALLNALASEMRSVLAALQGRRAAGSIINSSCKDKTETLSELCASGGGCS